MEVESRMLLTEHRDSWEEHEKMLTNVYLETFR